MSKQTNRLGIKILGMLDGIAEGPFAIGALVIIVATFLVLYRF
jgi:hypothetical protein